MGRNGDGDKRKEEWEIGRNGDGEKYPVALSPHRPVALSPLRPVTPSLYFFLEAMKGVEPLSTGLQDRRSDIQLSYIAMNLVDWKGFKPSQEVCKTSMLSVTSPAPESYRWS